MNEDEMVVGIGLARSSRDIADGVMPYEKVKAVIPSLSRPLESREALERWVNTRDISDRRDIVLRLWDDGKVIQPLLLDPNYRCPGDRWIPFKDFK